MRIQTGVNLQPHNTLGLPAMADTLIHIETERGLRSVVNHPVYGRAPKFILGGGSNVVLARDLSACVLKIEIAGRRLLEEREDAWIIEAGAGERWHDLVMWTLEQGWPGLENLALIPGTVGAAPVQNIGAYGLELADRLASVTAVDLITGRTVELDARQCRFGYRDSIFKQALAGKSVITRVRLRLPKPWQPVLGYLDLQRKLEENPGVQPSPDQIAAWVCEIRRAKLPDPALIGNVGSFFKNPVVTAEQCRDIIARDPHLVHYPMEDGQFKLAAGWLIDACGWKGKGIGHAAVHDRQALVLVNRGGARGAEIITLANAIQVSVYGRFGIRLEPEPVIMA